jgi:hypothetical protein
MLYAQEVRPQIVKDNAGISVVEVAKLIGQKWKELSQNEKEPYYKKAKASADEAKARENL